MSAIATDLALDVLDGDLVIANGDEFTCDCGERYMVSDGDENDAPYLVRMEDTP